MIHGQLFETPIGTCAVAWSDAGLRALMLPDRDDHRTATRLRRSYGAAEVAPTTSLDRAPSQVQQLAARLQAHLSGELRDDLGDVTVDLADRSGFVQRVYRALRRVPPGETVTYAALARRAVGTAAAARAVGRAMASNPLPLVVPCHRVISSDSPGQYSAPGGLVTKLRLLTIEGADLASFRRAAARELRRRDERLAPIIRKAGRFPLRPRPVEDYFDVLAASIVHQQVSMSAGRTIFGRLVDRFGEGGRLQPQALMQPSTSELRRAGVSRQKGGYLVDLARRVCSGELLLQRLAHLDDEQVIRELIAVKGIGRWTAEMFLIFCLARPDVLPVDDLGLQQAVCRVHRLRQPDRKRIELLARRWAPYRSAATWYLWRALEAGGL